MQGGHSSEEQNLLAGLLVNKTQFFEVVIQCRRSDHFNLFASEIVQMSDFGLKDNVGLMVVLTARPQGSPLASSLQELPVIAIANTHLIFNPKRGDIKVKAMPLRAF